MKDISDLAAKVGPGNLRTALESQLVEEIQQTPPGQRPLPPISWAESFLSHPEPEPAELVSSILHEGCKMVLGGSSKSNKTWTLMDLALSVASGTEWIGFETKQAPVLYCNFEVQAPFFHTRLKRIMEAKELNSPHKLALWNLRGHAADLGRIRGQIAEQAKQEGFKLLVIDPLYKLLGGRNENESAAMGELMNEIEQIAVDTGAAVAFGAHYSKGNQAAKESIDRISGSGVFARDPDSILTMTAHEEAGAFTVEPILRNHAPIDPFAIRWDFPLMRRDGGLDPAKLKKPKTGREAVYGDEAMLGPISDGEGLTAAEWQRAVQDECGMSRRTFYERKEGLTRKKKARQDAITGKWVAA